MGEQITAEHSLRQVEVRLKLIDGPPLYGGTVVRTPDDAVDLMRGFMSDLDKEYFCVVNFDASCAPLGFNVVSMGDINMCYVPLQNVFKSAILQNAASIMAFHNHPSGDISPSQQDFELTKRLSAASNFMNIKLLDHIIIGGGNRCYESLNQSYPELFNLMPDFTNLKDINSRTIAAENVDDNQCLLLRRHR